MLNSRALPRISSLYETIYRDTRELLRLRQMVHPAPVTAVEKGTTPRSLISISDSGRAVDQASVAYNRAMSSADEMAAWRPVWLSLIESLSTFLEWRIAHNKAELARFGFEWNEDLDMANIGGVGHV
jgi:hypothetical protein